MKQQLFVFLTVTTALFLFSGMPTFLLWLVTAPSNYIIFAESPTMISLAPAIFFVYFLGFLGFYFWTRTDYPYYNALFIAGTVLVFIATVTIPYLWNVGHS